MMQNRELLTMGGKLLQLNVELSVQHRYQQTHSLHHWRHSWGRYV